MAIDRIGKGGAIPQAPDGASEGSHAKRTNEVGEARAPFSVENASRAGAPTNETAAQNVASADAASAASPLGRLRAGEVDVNGYVDLKVDEATKGLEGLSAEGLEDIKSILRDQLRTDPGLADLVRSATGKMPTPPEE